MVKVLWSCGELNTEFLLTKHSKSNFKFHFDIQNIHGQDTSNPESGLI